MVNNNSWIVTWRRRFALALSHPLLDLSIAAVSAAVLGIVVVVDLGLGWGIRSSLVLLTLTLLPGYILIAIVYPWNDQHRRDAFQPTCSERAALAFGTSIALHPLLALVPALLRLEYTPMTTLAVIEALVAVGIPIAVYRRMGIQRSDQFRLPLSDWMSGLSRCIGNSSRSRQVLRAAMIMSILLAVVSFSYVLAVPQDGERYSTMTLLTENEFGDLVTADYPSNMVVGEPAELTLAIENDRQQETTYTVVIRLERVVKGDSQQIRDTEELGRFEPTVTNDETWTRQHTVTPTMAREDLRLRYYLYVGEPPELVGPETARDYLHVWVDVGPV